MAAGEIESVTVQGVGARHICDTAKAVPRVDRGTALLCLFDPVIFFWQWVEWLFGFRYCIEIYTSAVKRQYSYIFVVAAAKRPVGRAC